MIIKNKQSTKLSILMVLFPLILGLIQCGVSLKEYKDTPGQFKVALPQAPEKRQESMTYRGESVPLFLTFIQNFQSHSFLVSHCNLPKTWVANRSAQNWLNDIKNSAISRMKATIIHEETLTNATPALEIMALAQNKQYRIRWYLSKGRLYQVSIAAQNIDKSLADKYFDSFRLIM